MKGCRGFIVGVWGLIVGGGALLMVSGFASSKFWASA